MEQTNLPRSLACGGVLSSRSGVITSPGFDLNNSSAVYAANEECVWIIVNSLDAAQSTINLQFTHLETETTAPLFSVGIGVRKSLKCASLYQ